MNDRDEIKELFSKKLAEHQVQVNPELWNGIQSQLGGLGSGVAVGSSVVGKSLILKGIAGVVLISGMGIGSYFFLKDDAPKNPAPVVQEVVTTPQVEEVEAKIEVEETPNKERNTVSETELPPIMPQAIFCGEGLSTDNLPSKQDPVSGEVGAVESAIVQQQKEVSTHTETQVQKSSNQPQKAEVVAKDIQENTQTNLVESKQQVSKGAVKPWSETNIFTPNGDGINDYFYLETNNLSEFSISILDKNNRVVYRTEDPSFHWDGRNITTNEMVPEGTYFYIVIAKDERGEYIKQYQTLQIAR